MAFIRPYRASDFEACANICIATLPPSLTNGPSPTKEEVAHLSPYLWTHPYTYLSPETSHVLDAGDGTGTAVGYCIGCPDVHAFVTKYAGYVADILSRDVERPAQLETRELFWTQGGSEMTANPAAMAQLAYRADWMLLGDDGDDDDDDDDGYEDQDGDDVGDETATTTATTTTKGSRKITKAELTRRWRATMHIDIMPGWQGQGWGRRLIEAFVASVQASGADYGEGEHIGVADDNRKVLGFYRQLGFRVVRDQGGITLVRDIERPS